ncbi:MAG: hypothetical protein ACOC8K_09720 [Gemmatimonadota bacterium]
MTAATWITMIAVLLFVWGGFLVALTIAVRKEAGKRTAGDPTEGPTSGRADGPADGSVGGPAGAGSEHP